MFAYKVAKSAQMFAYMVAKVPQMLACERSSI